MALDEPSGPTVASLPAEFSTLRDRWITLLREGSEEADRYYFDVIMEAILPAVRARAGGSLRWDGLISLLGFSPETTVLSARVLRPERLVVLHTPETSAQLPVVLTHAGLPTEAIASIAFRHDEGHPDEIYQALAAALQRFPATARLAVDITGGKKTMSNQIAIAVAILRQRGRSVSLSYVDYDAYLPALRKPEPASTRLRLVDDPIAVPLALFGGP